MVWAKGIKNLNGRGNTPTYFFLAVSLVVGNTENIILLRQQMRHHKSVAILHIFCIQLEFEYLP